MIGERRAPGNTGAGPRRRGAAAERPSRPSAAGSAPGARSSSCEIPGGGAQLERSCVLRFDGTGWEGVPTEPYKQGGDGFAGISRRLLASPAGAAFELRYFELEPGGYSSHERHEHVHVVVCLRGSGCVRIGDAVADVGFGDLVHIAPGEAHQFLNPTDAPFGFLCIVDRERDRPVPVTETPLT